LLKGCGELLASEQKRAVKIHPVPAPRLACQGLVRDSIAGNSSRKAQ
jgi:hypothetical protein